MATLPGVYMWSYSSGAFPVSLRSNSIFYCKSHSASAKWKSDGDNLKVDWANYGQYEFSAAKDASGEFIGSLIDNPSKWRKMTFLRPFSPAETLLLGDGGGSVWNFEYEGGAFEVEFRADGYNHFVCKSYPSHSHWAFIDDAGTAISINWGKYGEYELEIDAIARTMKVKCYSVN